MRWIACTMLLSFAGCGDTSPQQADLSIADLASGDLSGLGAVGAPCTDGTQCATGQCITEAKHGLYVGGYCSVLNCSNNCPSGSECFGGGAIGTTGCFEECPLGGACRTGYKCCPTTNDLGGNGLCVPATGTALGC